MDERFGVFDFGLTEDQEARAARLHRESIIVDLLHQGPGGYRVWTDEMVRELHDRVQSAHDITGFGLARHAWDMPIRLALEGQLPEYYEHWRQSGVTAGARFVDVGNFGVFAWSFGLMQAQFDSFDWLAKATSAADIRRAKAEGKHAGFVNTQVVAGPFASIEFLDAAYDLGLRMAQLTYNSMTTVGGGCEERTDAGVSNFGAALIRRMNELGVIVDTSHAGRRTTLDACELSSAPVVASHTSAQAVHFHIRGVSDEEIRAIAETGGVLGVIASPPIVRPGDPDATIEAMLDHIDHIVHLVGSEHAAIGTDFPPPLPRSQAVTEELYALLRTLGPRSDFAGSRPTLDGFDDYRDFPNITRGLVKRGYSDNEIKAILGENALRVFERVWG